MSYTRKTDAEIKQLAIDTLSGRAFHSLYMTDQDMVPSVFMVLSFLDAAAIEDLKNDDIVDFYEYIEAAGPRSVNGYPMFMSMQTLNQEDAERMHKVVLKLKEAQENVEV